MVESIEMKCVGVTFFTVCATPIPPYYDHQGVDVSAVVPDGRDLAIFTHIGGMLDKKEFAHSVPADDTFSVFDQEGPNLKSLAGQCWIRCVR
jgi:hypothetical protein